MRVGKVHSPDDERADAEAAAWLARLQRPDRDEALEVEFRGWLASAPPHAAAFDRATQVWDVIGGVGADEPGFWSVGRGRAKAAQVRWRGLAAVASLAVVLLAGWWWSERPTVYETQRGGRQMVALADGSEILLNTNTRLKVRYTRDRRSVALEHGEAIFDVAKNHARPFVVTAAGRDVRATGTSFSVRNSDDALAVTLLEGSVVVATTVGSAAGRDGPGPVTLSPGDQLRIAGEHQSMNRPPLDVVTAWRRGEVIFEATPLSSAVAEMNRYSGRQLALASPEVGRLQVNGQFKAADSEAFAKAVAALYSLNLIPAPGGALLLSAGGPSA